MQPQHQVETSNTSPGRLGHDSARSGGIDECAQPDLPVYIRPLPSRITAEDYGYLTSKDALHIPDEELRDELLRTYVDVVHPFMPVLDINSFLTPVVRCDGHSHVSLLLFQAVMFASVAFVDAQFLRTRGYRNRKAARKAFFSRVRLLYGLDCEPDRLALLQSLMLMTYWYDNPDDEKDTWHWMGTALSLAQVLGFHRNPALLRLSSQERKLRSRIWWSCFMRDRQLAIGLRRPPRIRDDDYDVPILTLHDFNLEPPSPDLASFLGQSSFTDANAREVLAMLCIDLAKLCLCMGHIVYSQYTLLGNCPTGSENLLKVIVMPRSEGQEETLISCDAGLEKWIQSQDERCKYTPILPASPENGDSIAKRVIRLHQAVLHMLYLTTVAALHRPHVFRSEPGAVDGPNTQRASRKKVTEAAIAMTRLAFDLQSSNQLRHLPSSSISAFLSAALIHLLDSRSHDEGIRNVSIGRFYQCVQVLQHLQDMYSSADYTLNFLGSVLKRTDVNVPGLGFVFPSGLAGERIQDLSRCAHSLPNLRGTARIDTAYPSPSGSGNNQASREIPGGPESGSQVDPIRASTPMQYTATEAWPSRQGTAVQDRRAGEIMTDMSQISLWGDMDSLFPALFNFDGEANASTLNNGPRPSSEWPFPSLDFARRDDYSRV